MLELCLKYITYKAIGNHYPGMIETYMLGETEVLTVKLDF